MMIATNGGTGMTARVGLIAVICHVMAVLVVCPGGIANPSPESRSCGVGQGPPTRRVAALHGDLPLEGEVATERREVSGGGLGLADSRFEFESKHMGTTFRVVLHAKDEATARKAADAAFARVADL